MLPPAWFALALLLTAGAAALEDLATRRIPNPLLSAALACAVLMQAIGGDLAAMSVGMLVAGLLLPLYLFGGMGAGDVKLVAVLGAFGGPLLAFHVVVVSLLLFGAVALAGLHAGLVVRRQSLPFAPAVAAASVFALAQDLF